MEKRTMVALGLTIVLIFFFQMYFSPKAPEQQPQTTQKSTDAPGKVETKTPGPGPQTSLPAGLPSPVQKTELKPTREITVETDMLQVTFTDLGGAIRSVRLKKYKETVKGPESKEIIEDVKPYVYIPKVLGAISGDTASDRTIFTSDRDKVVLTDKPETITM